MTLTPQQRAELEASEERRLSADEFRARVEAPWSAQELADFEALCAWFRRRYPTPLERLRATRDLMAQWQNNVPR